MVGHVLPCGRHVNCCPLAQFSFKLSRAKRVTCQLAPRSGRGVCGGLPRITTQPRMSHNVTDPSNCQHITHFKPQNVSSQLAILSPVSSASVLIILDPDGPLHSLNRVQDIPPQPQPPFEMYVNLLWLLCFCFQLLTLHVGLMGLRGTLTRPPSLHYQCHLKCESLSFVDQ
jgi:hypothetical protein